LPGQRRKLSLYSGLTDDGAAFDWVGLVHAINAALDVDAHDRVKGNHAVLRFEGPADPVKALRQGIRCEAAPAVDRAQHRAVQGHRHAGPGGRALRLRASRGLAPGRPYTRMATESAVTPDRAHPFTAGEDFCLVHNGSLSNPNDIRRKLEPHGIRFETDNDTEAACRFLEWRLREGDDLDAALQKGFEELDGFYTFLMGTARKSSRSSATRSPASPRWWPKPTTTSPSRPSSARWPTCPTSSTPTCSNPRPRRCTTVRVKGFASNGAGASAHGGLLIIEGDAGLRCGISLKGGDIVVGGSVGSFSGFMAQAGRMVICGDAGDALGDSLYEAVIYVRGAIKSLGADARIEPLTASDIATLGELLGAAGLRHDPASFKRVASARTLYHWNADADQEY
jgi:hypothetical protein